MPLVVIIKIIFFIESANGAIILNTNGRTSASTPNFLIGTTGNVGIGTNNPSNILQVGNGARLRISNSESDYTLIGTKDVHNATNTKIVISGNTRPYPYTGHIEYVATSGYHIFQNGGATEKYIIANNGNVYVNSG